VGKVVTKNVAEGVKWYRRVLDDGQPDWLHASALGRLGDCYESGKGVPKNVVEAYAYYCLASLADSSARERLKALRDKMNPQSVARGEERSEELQKEIEAKIAAKKAAK
jgi:hypothetical protein